MIDWVAEAPGDDGVERGPRTPRARSYAILATLMIAIIAALLVVALISQAGR